MAERPAGPGEPGQRARGDQEPCPGSPEPASLRERAARQRGSRQSSCGWGALLRSRAPRAGAQVPSAPRYGRGSGGAQARWPAGPSPASLQTPARGLGPSPQVLCVPRCPFLGAPPGVLSPGEGADPSPCWTPHLAPPGESSLRGWPLARVRPTMAVRPDGSRPRPVPPAGAGPWLLPASQPGRGSCSLSFPSCNLGRKRVQHPPPWERQNMIRRGRGRGAGSPPGPPGPPTRCEVLLGRGPRRPSQPSQGQEGRPMPSAGCPHPLQGIRSRAQNKGSWQPAAGRAQPRCPLSPASWRKPQPHPDPRRQ